MKSFVAIAAAAALAIPALAAPAAIPITKLAGPAKSDSYIIKLKDGVSKDSHIARLLKAIGSLDSKVTYKYDNVFHGYAGVLKGPILDFIRRSSEVEYVQADTIYTIDYFEGDEKLSARAVDLQEPDLARRIGNGAGVNIYGIDTGILTTHSSFGGRAKWGATYGGYASKDGNGHGTHTAATAAGSGYGLATGASITAVKVCSDAGQCASSDIIAGVNYAVTQGLASGKPTVATMSLGGGADSAIDSAVSNGISKGVHFTIAAGNSNVNAANTSPARVAAANTIGAVDSSNRKASFSNYGSILDVWALGVNVKSAWIGSNSASNTISGTSMATPQVAGILAVALGSYGSVSPASLSSSLKSHAAAVVTGAPSGTTKLKAQAW
ncbi:cuticle-degrading protease [Ceratobasidium sp. AG-Ba]|nr:cuticle-degrading protease [Ceratobasidium sp. AG-Ba]QRW02591.1 cuticle-degrading protease [Ceratobasidium sp. AG-Ba]